MINHPDDELPSLSDSVINYSGIGTCTQKNTSYPHSQHSLSLLHTEAKK